MNFGDQIRSISEITVFQNTVGKYVAALAVLVIFAFVFTVAKKLFVYHLGKLAAKTTNDFDDLIINLVGRIGPIVILTVSFYIASLSLILPEAVRSVIKYAFIIVVAVRVILLFQEIVRYGVGKAYRRRVSPQDPSAEAMAKNITGILRWVIWSVGFIFVLDNLGVNISALVAGIGIGGIAVALAAQAVLADAFSALSIFLDKPFEIGDFIIVDDYLGTVEHVGVKTTRIRSLSGEQLIFPNANLTSSRVKNYKRMETRRIDFKMGIVYQTPLEKVKKVPEIIREIFGKMNGARLDRVHFQSFGDFALIYEIVYYVLSADYNVYMDRQQEINFEIMARFEKEGIEFAYPTQTLYVKKQDQ